MTLYLQSRDAFKAAAAVARQYGQGSTPRVARRGVLYAAVVVTPNGRVYL